MQSTPVDIPLKAVDTPQESLPTDQVNHSRMVKFELVELSSISKLCFEKNYMNKYIFKT